MTKKEYRVTSLELSLDERAYEINGTTATIDIVLPDEPRFVGDGDELHCEYELEIRLSTNDGELDDEDSHNDEKRDIFAEIDVSFTAVVIGEGQDLRDKFEEVIETWEGEGYRALPSDFRGYLESGILSDILAPISNMSTGLRGVLPALPFSRDLPEEDEEDSQDFDEEEDQGSNEE